MMERPDERCDRDGAGERHEPGRLLRAVTGVLLLVPLVTFALCVLAMLAFAVALVVRALGG
jgi:hypothetical protein